MKRQRGRGRKPQNQGNRSFESNGPEVKIRGNPSQIYDKYLQLARDASTSGDRVRAENLFQHAEHYYRIVQANMPKRDPNQDDFVEGQDGDVEEGSGEQPQRETREQREPRRARPRNDRNDRNPRHDRNDRNANRTQRDPMDVVTPEASPAPVTDVASPAPTTAPAAPAVEAAAPAEETPRPRTRRPRRPRVEAKADTDTSKAEEALKSASDDADKTGGDDSSESAVA